MKGDDLSTAKLGDFGFALRLTAQGTVSLPACGTPEYVAPEVLLQQPLDGKADVWSAGVTAFCLLSGSMPFRGLTLDKLYTAIMNGACSYAGPEWARVSPPAVDFVKKMLKMDPEDRWSAAQLLNHPWILGGRRVVKVGGGAPLGLHVDASTEALRKGEIEHSVGDHEAGSP